MQATQLAIAIAEIEQEFLNNWRKINKFADAEDTRLIRFQQIPDRTKSRQIFTRAIKSLWYRYAEFKGFRWEFADGMGGIAIAVYPKN